MDTLGSLFDQDPHQAAAPPFLGELVQSPAPFGADPALGAGPDPFDIMTPGCFPVMAVSQHAQQVQQQQLQQHCLTQNLQPGSDFPTADPMDSMKIPLWRSHNHNDFSAVAPAVPVLDHPLDFPLVGTPQTQQQQQLAQLPHRGQMLLQQQQTILQPSSNALNIQALLQRSLGDRPVAAPLQMRDSSSSIGVVSHLPALLLCFTDCAQPGGPSQDIVMRTLSALGEWHPS